MTAMAAAKKNTEELRVVGIRWLSCMCLMMTCIVSGVVYIASSYQRDAGSIAAGMLIASPKRKTKQKARRANASNSSSICTCSTTGEELGVIPP